MNTVRALAAALLALAAFGQSALPQAIVKDLTHHSAVLSEDRHFRIFLPPGYDSQPSRRYPVVYFFHGWGERYNQYTDEVKNYDSGSDYGGDNISTFVGAHDVILVKWDGFNPRRPGERYLRPYNIGPVETYRQFPLYFLELVEYIDHSFRTIADREHRAVSGVSMGGFMSLWIGGKYPDMIGSVSSFMPAPEYFAGPREFPAEYQHVDMYPNYNGVRTRLITGTRDFLRWYHRRMNAVWDFARADYEREEFDSEHGTPGMAKTLAFHMDAFRNPRPRPELWHHWDVYPAFDVWGWSVSSNRRQPGFTSLENVSRSGFRSAVREWAPNGAPLPAVALHVVTAPLYKSFMAYQITDLNLDTGAVRITRQTADAAGKLDFSLDGARHEVGIARPGEPVLTIPDVRIEGTPWVTDGKQFRLVLSILNKGAGRAPEVAASIALLPNVTTVQSEVCVPALARGTQARVAFDMTVEGGKREMLCLRVNLRTRGGVAEVPVNVQFFRNVPELGAARLLDGSQAAVWIHGDKQQMQANGGGNGNGIAEPGEKLAIGVLDRGAYRLLELFTNDPCVDNTGRITDIWPEHEGQLAHYSFPLIKPGCTDGHEIPFFARWVVPNGHEHILNEGSIRIRVDARKRRP